MKKAFTLPEAVICVAIVAVIAAIMVPGLIKIKPDEEKIMVKKAYNTTSEIISYLANDVSVFSRMQADGFADGLLYKDLDENTFQGDTKFCNVFKSKLNLADDSGTTTTGATHGCVSSFVSVDGIEWTVRTNPTGNLASDINSRTDQANYITVNFKAPKPSNARWWALNVSRYGRISVPVDSLSGGNNKNLIELLADVNLNK